MKNSVQVMLVVLVVILGAIVGSKMIQTDTKDASISQQETEKSDPFKELRSDKKHVEEEALIKKTVDKYMYENFGSVFKTTWFDAVKGTGVVINEYGRMYIVQSNGDDEKAKEYVGGLLSFFNSKATNAKYNVDKIILVNSDKKIIHQVDTIKW
ncbi:hypothetical protein [Candidatus Pristimantibacillus sp. PTI5]|uniref:hypothetical protein n=1 Tax=Candidatus Pristimantibacillus sp. PTI5 TaxID=3400422 RepID=UPI003B0213FC